MSNSTIYQLFPKMLTTSILNLSDGQNISLKDYVSKTECTQSSDTSIPSCYGSKDKFILNDSRLKFFKNIIMHEFDEFKNSIMRLDDTTFEMTTSWMTKTPKGHFSTFHNHSNSMFSGVFYFDDSSDIEFIDLSTRQFYAVPNQYNDYNCDAYIIEPKKNMVIFFDSRLYHKVAPNNLDATRYSLAFNFIPTSGIGQGDSQICFKLGLDN